MNISIGTTKPILISYICEQLHISLTNNKTLNEQTNKNHDCEKNSNQY